MPVFILQVLLCFPLLGRDGKWQSLAAAGLGWTGGMDWWDALLRCIPLKVSECWDARRAPDSQVVSGFPLREKNL